MHEWIYEWMQRMQNIANQLYDIAKEMTVHYLNSDHAFYAINSNLLFSCHRLSALCPYSPMLMWLFPYCTVKWASACVSTQNANTSSSSFLLMAPEMPNMHFFNGDVIRYTAQQVNIQNRAQMSLDNVLRSVDRKHVHVTEPIDTSVWYNATPVPVHYADMLSKVLSRVDDDSIVPFLQFLISTGVPIAYNPTLTFDINGMPTHPVGQFFNSLWKPVPDTVFHMRDNIMHLFWYAFVSSPNQVRKCTNEIHNILQEWATTGGSVARLSEALYTPCQKLEQAYIKHVATVKRTAIETMKHELITILPAAFYTIRDVEKKFYQQMSQTEGRQLSMLKIALENESIKTLEARYLSRLFGRNKKLLIDTAFAELKDTFQDVNSMKQLHPFTKYWLEMRELLAIARPYITKAHIRSLGISYPFSHMYYHSRLVQKADIGVRMLIYRDIPNKLPFASSEKIADDHKYTFVAWWGLINLGLKHISYTMEHGSSVKHHTPKQQKTQRYVINGLRHAMGCLRFYPIIPNDPNYADIYLYAVDFQTLNQVPSIFKDSRIYSMQQLFRSLKNTIDQQSKDPSHIYELYARLLSRPMPKLVMVNFWLPVSHASYLLPLITGRIVPIHPYRISKGVFVHKYVPFMAGPSNEEPAKSDIEKIKQLTSSQIDILYRTHDDTGNKESITEDFGTYTGITKRKVNYRKKNAK